MGFLERKEIEKIGFASFGENVKISERAVFYGAEKISIGHNTRIDDFCIISAGAGGIFIGSYIHISAYCSLQGQGKIVLEDFSGLSSKCAIYSSTDDYGGEYLTNPCVPIEFSNVISGPVILRKHVIVGSGTAILPNVEIGAGSAIGALSLVTKNIPESSIAMGTPAKVLKTRSKKLFELEKKLLGI